MEALEQSKVRLKSALSLLEAKIHEQIKTIQTLRQENKRLIAKNVEIEAQLTSLKQASSKINVNAKDVPHKEQLVNRELDLDMQPIQPASSVEISINELKNMVSK